MVVVQAHARALTAAMHHAVRVATAQDVQVLVVLAAVAHDLPLEAVQVLAVDTVDAVVEVAADEAAA